ncbi:hypothetical protein [Corynebacterium jeddahense]|uniref:Uncharacterized protein n=1 Tax=Corynebacterium jeddahense TaxID=1414719 RepID=A0ABY7UGJ5_9CORY|nr:hypothetical protein [Corynebacterium jeddahense]WCZ37853.1 hypothetical protein CJEDD_01130 [Corynebacterium jeddahense]
MVRIDIDNDAIFMQVMGSDRVQAKVQEKATRIAALTRRELARASIDAAVKIEPHPTSSGRAAFNVVGSVARPEDARKAGRIARRAGRSLR